MADAFALQIAPALGAELRRRLTSAATLAEVAFVVVDVFAALTRDGRLACRAAAAYRGEELLARHGPPPPLDDDLRGVPARLTERAFCDPVDGGFRLGFAADDVLFVVASHWALPISVLEACALQTCAVLHRDDVATHAALARAHEQLALDALAAARKATEDAETELRTRSEKLQRTQRAMLNLIGDLREARATLERRVEERTKRIVEILETKQQLENEREALLARERASRLEAEAARTQAESASRMKDQFLSTVSHELRTPLNAILGWATLLRDGRLDPSRRSAAIDTIERNARAQVRLIDDLLDLGRILQGKFQLAVAPVEVVRIIEAAIDTVRPAAEAKGVRLQHTLDSHATIVGDAERLQQIAWNLLSNAIKFTPRGGRVHVTVHRAPSFVELSVADTGQGIAAEFLGHVFEPFRQADGAVSRRAGGLGLGLSIVRSLVELHGGTVTVTSDGPGKGALFTVRLPVAPLRAVPSETPAPADGSTTFERPAELTDLRILVVDDERDTRELIAFLLEQCAARVTMASCVSEAMEKIEAETFDVLVSDVGMPEEDGLSMIRRIRKLPAPRGRIPAVALTAYARSEDRAQAIRAGFNMHLAKPVDPTELALVVASLVRS